MSGIAGCVYWDGNFVSELCLKKMAGALGHRGISNILSCNEAGFVQINQNNCHLSYCHPTLPISDSRYIISFHGRIDNCREIYNQIETRIPLSDFTYEIACLEAFKRWGDTCATKLIGDFAFAIWDNNYKSLYCCRDHMGVKPFYYIATPFFFAFASEIKALFTLPDIKKDINNERLADYLVLFVTEQKATFFKNIYKLQPSHYLLVDRYKNVEKKYWQLERPQIVNSSFEENAELFFHLFKEAVRTRLPVNSKVGSFLSGGVDSSSIVCMSAGCLANDFQGTLNTFSHTYNRLSQCDERKYFQSILDRYQIKSHFSDGDEINPANAFEDRVKFEDEPFEGFHFFTSWHLLQIAGKENIHYIFDGHGGDSTVSLGVGLFPQLALQGEIFKFYSEILTCQNQKHKLALKYLFKTYCNLFQAIIPFLSYQDPLILQRDEFLKYLSPNLLTETCVVDRINRSLENSVPAPLQTEQQLHYNDIFQPFQSHALEFLERLSSRFGICSCFPYFDIRLIKFCLSLPAEYKLRNGYNRAIVRESLKDIVPEEIRKRRLKTDFRSNMIDAYLVRGKEWFEASYHDVPDSVYQYVDKKVAAELFTNCMTNKPTLSLSNDLYKMLRFFSLSKWLKKIN